MWWRMMKIRWGETNKGMRRWSRAGLNLPGQAGKVKRLRRKSELLLPNPLSLPPKKNHTRFLAPLFCLFNFFFCRANIFFVFAILFLSLFRCHFYRINCFLFCLFLPLFLHTFLFPSLFFFHSPWFYVFQFALLIHAAFHSSPLPMFHTFCLFVFTFYLLVSFFLSAFSSSSCS